MRGQAKRNRRRRERHCTDHSAQQFELSHIRLRVQTAPARTIENRPPPRNCRVCPFQRIKSCNRPSESTTFCWPPSNGTSPRCPRIEALWCPAAGPGKCGINFR
jgi:hypothetical protein